MRPRSILHPYVPAARTDIRVTFERERKRIAEEKARQLATGRNQQGDETPEVAAPQSQEGKQ